MVALGHASCARTSFQLPPKIFMMNAILTSDGFQECDLQFATENDWRRTLLRLLQEQDALNASDFDCWQKACGITFNPHAMIFSHKLVIS